MKLTPYILGLLMLTSCVPGKINNGYVDGRFPYQRLSHIPYNHALWADVSGNPFPGDQEAFNNFVNAAIQAPDIAPDQASEYHIHFVFNSDGRIPFSEICSNPPPKPRNLGKDVSAALCYAGKTYTALSATPPDVQSMDDPKYRKFLRYITARLFPGCETGLNC